MMLAAHSKRKISSYKLRPVGCVRLLCNWEAVESTNISLLNNEFKLCFRYEVSRPDDTLFIRSFSHSLAPIGKCGKMHFDQLLWNVIFENSMHPVIWFSLLARAMSFCVHFWWIYSHQSRNVMGQYLWL